MAHGPRTPYQALRKLLKLAARPMKSDRGRGGVVVQAYRGYGSTREAYLMGRVFRQPSLGLPAREGTLLRDLLDVLRRSVRWGVKAATVVVEIDGSRHTVETDRDGYFDVHDYIGLCREHYDRVGIGADHIDTLFR